MSDRNLSTQPCLTPAETDLLRAAFLAQPEAADAWQRWSADIDWDGYLDHTSFALLPRAYRNLRALGIDDPIFPRCKGIMHQAWLANQQLIAGLGSGLDALDEAGIAPVLLPPTWVLSRDRSAVLDRSCPLVWGIVSSEAEPAVRALLALGWTIDRVRVPSWSLAGYIAGARHLVLRPPVGPPWLLTWALDWWLDEPTVRAAAEACDLGGRSVQALATRDALSFLFCRPSGRDAFRLAADLLTIAELGTVGDWPIGIPAPANGLPPSWNECVDRLSDLFAHQGAPNGFGRVGPSIVPRPYGSPLHRLPADWRLYRAKLGTEGSALAPLVQLPGYLMGRWNLSHLRQLMQGAPRWLWPKWAGPR